jgi:hypothetical protein
MLAKMAAANRVPLDSVVLDITYHILVLERSPVIILIDRELHDKNPLEDRRQQ